MLRFWKWKWMWRTFFALLIITPIVVAIAWHFITNAGSAKVAAYARSLDETDPGWRLADIEKAYNDALPADDENPTVRAVSAYTKMGMPYERQRAAVQELEEHPKNALLPRDYVIGLQRLQKNFRSAIDDCKTLSKFDKEGGERLQFPVIPYEMRYVTQQNMRTIQDILRVALSVALEANDGDEAYEIVCAMCKAPRTLGIHPSFISFLVRLALQDIAASSTEKLLALSVPQGDLALIQSALMYEAELPLEKYVLRSERAIFHRTMEGIKNGEIDPKTLSKFLGKRLLSPVQQAQEEYDSRANFNKEWLYGLTSYTQVLRCMDDPSTQRKVVVDTLKEANKPYEESTNFFIATLDSHISLIESKLRGRGRLRAVAVGVACERYRQKFGKWPATLADIPKDILPAIPNDPFTDKPINYRRLIDGCVVVYTVGPDGIDHGGPTSDTNQYENNLKRDYGIKLYPPDKRRLPPPPPKPGEVIIDPNFVDPPEEPMP